MVKGERFERDGKTYEVTAVFGENYAFAEVEKEKEEIPVVVEKKKKKKV